MALNLKLGIHSHHSEADGILPAQDYRACGHKTDINIDFCEEHTQGKSSAIPEISLRTFCWT